MKIAIIGTKGIPPKYGGFETFAFHLAKELSATPFEVVVVNEKDNSSEGLSFPVVIRHSKYNKSKNPLRYYRESLRLVDDCVLVLVCGVGGSFFYPKKGNNIIVTNVDGLEHLRGKYTWLQRTLVFILQMLANKKSEHLIADSDEVKKYWSKRFGIINEKISAIAYGASIPEKFNDNALAEYGLMKDHYFLVVARLVPENNLQILLDAFKEYKGEKKLVVVGSKSDNKFAQEISEEKNPNVIFTGAIYEKEKLDRLRKNCFVYIHGHSVGGTNPALLEAMACACACICHDNVFNREVTDNAQLYFSDAEELLSRITSLEENETLRTVLSDKSLSRVSENYGWKKIADSYIELFLKLIDEFEESV